MSIENKISKLKELLDNDMLSQKEFEEMKEKLLNNEYQKTQNEEYYTIPISKFILITWLVISIFFSFSIFVNISTISTPLLFWLITLCFYLDFKSRKYYYNNEKIIVETGVLKEKQNIIPLYRVVNITAQDNIFGFGTIWIDDKGQTIILKNVINSKSEMLKLVDKWEIAKAKNIRQEVI